jgi:hypothetical protein
MAVFAVNTIEYLGGSPARGATAAGRGLAEIHRDELQHDWDLLQSGQPPVKIDPLRSIMTHPIHRVTRFSILGALDTEAGTLVWPTGADFDPATLHDWPQVRDDLANRARAWVDPASDEPRADTRMEPTRR